MLKKILVTGAAVSWFGTLFYFGVRNAPDLNDWDLLLAFISIAATGVAIGLHSTRFGTWSALWLCLLGFALTQGWLQWQWGLWETRYVNVNALVAVLTLDLFVAVLAVSTLLLIRRDASVLALGVVWLGCPLGLLASMWRYGTMAQIEKLPLQESSVVFLLACLLGFLAVGGIVAFSAHFLRLLYLELAGKT